MEARREFRSLATQTADDPDAAEKEKALAGRRSFNSQKPQMGRPQEAGGRGADLLHLLRRHPQLRDSGALPAQLLQRLYQQLAGLLQVSAVQLGHYRG